MSVVAPGGVSLFKVLALLLGFGLVATEGVQAWSNLNREVAAPSVTPGTLCSVMLLNGQIYYGDLVSANGRYVSLRDVYYVQTASSQQGGPPNNRLVSRRKTDWHAPTLMSIPADKVLMVEAVGPDSKLGQLVKQDRSSAAPP